MILFHLKQRVRKVGRKSHPSKHRFFSWMSQSLNDFLFFFDNFFYLVNLVYSIPLLCTLDSIQYLLMALQCFRCI